MQVIDYQPGGNSFPIVIKDGEEKHFVKLKAGMSGEYSLVSEWLGNQIALRLGINARKPSWIFLTASLDYSDMYIEIRDLIDKSKGYNLCFEYLESVEEVTTISANLISPQMSKDIFLLDVLTKNIDRTAQNHNLIITGERGIVVSDYESGLWVNELLNELSLATNSRVLQCLRANPFYTRIDRTELDLFLKKINEIDFDNLIKEIPDEILEKEKKHRLLNEISKRKERAWELKFLLSKIDDVNLETEYERNSRIRQNRDKLLALVRSGK